MTSRKHSSSSTVENLRMASNKKGISIGGLAEPRNRATKAAAIAHTRKSHSQGCNNCWVYLILRDGQRKWIPVTRAHRLKVLRKKRIQGHCLQDHHYHRNHALGFPQPLISTTHRYHSRQIQLQRSSSIQKLEHH